MAHRIRLRKPWTRHELLRTAAISNGDTVEIDSDQHARSESSLVDQVDVPDLEGADDDRTDSLSGDQNASGWRIATYCRRFNRPSGVEASDRVQLEVGSVAGRLVDVRINSKTIADFAPNHPHVSARYDITADLADRNDLEIEISANNGKPRLQGAVNLWIVSQNK